MTGDSFDRSNFIMYASRLQDTTAPVSGASFSRTPWPIPQLLDVTQAFNGVDWHQTKSEAKKLEHFIDMKNSANYTLRLKLF